MTQPATAAGRALLAEFTEKDGAWHGSGMTAAVEHAILAIEAEAAAPAALDVDRLRLHEPEQSYLGDRWDCSCGWHDDYGSAQIWWSHIAAENERLGRDSK